MTLFIQTSRCICKCVRIVIIFSCPFGLTYVLDAIVESVLLSTHNICFGWELRKLISALIRFDLLGSSPTLGHQLKGLKPLSRSQPWMVPLVQVWRLSNKWLVRYEGGSICNENPFITPSTSALWTYAICQTKDQNVAVKMVHGTLFYLSKFNKLHTF